METPDIHSGSDEERAQVQSWAVYRIKERDVIWVLTLPGGEVAAYVAAWTIPWRPQVLHIEAVEVRPDLRRRGHGRALIGHFQQDATYHTISAEWVVWESVDFWAALGFLPDGRDDWYEEEYEWAGDFVWHHGEPTCYRPETIWGTLHRLPTP